MDQPTALARLRDVLAVLYPEEESARRVADDAGLDARRIAFDSQALDNWHAILWAAIHQGRRSELCDVVCKEYNVHQELRAACNAFLSAEVLPNLPNTIFKGNQRPWLRWLMLTLLALVVIGGILLFTTVIPTAKPTATPAPSALPTATYALQASVSPTPNLSRCLPDRLCILVARFAPEDNETATQFTDKLVQEIRTVLDAAATERFTVAIVPPVDDPEVARRLAGENGALLIVWGQLFTALDKEPQATVNFQMADLLGVGESQSTRPYRVQPLFYDAIAGYCANCLYLEASQRTSVVAYTVAGLTHYVQQRSRQALHDFLAALYCAGELEQTKANQIIRIVQPACTPPATPLPWNLGLLYYYIGKAFYLEGNYREAKTYLEQATIRNPADPAAWIALAGVWQDWLARPTAPEVQVALRTAEEKTKQLLGEVAPAIRPVVYFDSGFAHELASNASGAQKDYQAAAEGLVAAGYSPYVAWIGLARAQRMAGEQAAAQATLTRTVALAPELPWAYLELALLNQKERIAAETWLQQAATYAPSEASVVIVRARLCRIWEDYGCAAYAYAQAIQQRPESGLLYLEVGDFYRPSEPLLPHQNLAQAEKYYKTAVQELRPADPSAHQRFAFVLGQRQAYPEAIEHYQRVVDLVSSDAEAATYYCDIGHLQKADGSKAEAKISFQHCANLTTDAALRQKAMDWLKVVSE